MDEAMTSLELWAGTTTDRLMLPASSVIYLPSRLSRPASPGASKAK
jgi:hypothetical protein